MCRCVDVQTHRRLDVQMCRYVCSCFFRKNPSLRRSRKNKQKAHGIPATWAVLYSTGKPPIAQLGSCIQRPSYQAFLLFICVLQIQHKIRPGVPFDHQLRMVNRLCHPHHCHPSFSHLAKNSAVPCHRSYLESENLRQVPNMFRTLKKMQATLTSDVQRADMPKHDGATAEYVWNP